MNIHQKYKTGVNNATQQDVDDILKQRDTLREKGEKLAEIWEDIKTAYHMLKDYVSGKYKGIPWSTIAAIVFALLYLISPLDTIPDGIPILGLADDAAVLTFVFARLKEPIRNYRKWKNLQNETIEI